MNLFDMNGPLMNALRTLSNIFLCNAMFCLCSLPLFTVGASLAALYTCMQAVIADDEDDVIIKQFLNAFKSNFKQGTIIWFFCLLVFALLGLYYTVIAQISGGLGKMYRISFFLMCFLFLFGFQYFFPLQARYQNRVKNTLKNAWILGIAAFPWTLLSIVLVIAAVYLSFFMNPAAFNTAIFLWGAIGFGLIVYLNSLIFQNAFKMIDPKKMDTGEREIPEEAIFIDEEHLPGEESGKRKRRR